MNNYKPCLYTIQATALGISPIYIEQHFIKVEDVRKIMLLEREGDKNEFLELQKSMNINQNKEIYSVKELIGLLSYAIRAEKIHYKNGKQRIKHYYFFKKEKVQN